MEDHQKTQERRIDGADYSSTPLSPEVGLSVAARVFKLLGGGAVDLMKSASAEDETEMESAAGAAIAAIAARIDEKSVVKLIRDLLSRTVRRKDGQKFELANDSDFNLAFAANYGELFKAIWFAIEVNRFLGSGGGITGLFGAMSTRFQGLTSSESSSGPTKG